MILSQYLLKSKNTPSCWGHRIEHKTWMMEIQDVFALQTSSHSLIQWK
jgi:hypothetical protein